MFENLFKGATLKPRINLQDTKDLILRKFPLLGVTMSQTKVTIDENCETASTNGSDVKVSSDFFEPLSDGERAFVLAHEYLHIAFNHLPRCKDRDLELWNIATDAVINQLLINEGLPMLKVGVNIPEAAGHSAEEMYELLLEKQKEKQQQNKDKQGQQSEQQQSGQQQSDEQQSDKAQSKPQQNNNGNPQSNSEQNEQNSDTDSWFNQKPHDNHKGWQDSVEQAERAKGKKHSWTRGDSKSREQEPETDVNELEKNFTADNKQQKQEMAKKIRESLERQKNQYMARLAENNACSFGDVGESAAVMDWKKILKKSIEEEESRWSYRRSGADNDYMARVEDLEEESQSETQVMLDVSGSVDEELLKEFLRQLKPILKTSKLNVGCFDHRVFPFVEIKKAKDIDNFKFTGRGGTNIDQAVRAFSKKKEVNKIVFTDGEGGMPRADLKNVNVIWLIYNNRNFNPVCGKVIYVDAKKIKQNYNSGLSLDTMRDSR